MTESGPRALIAGLGNIFFGDDAFGVEVARVLASRPLPPGIRVLDVGIRGVHLAYEIAAGAFDTVVIVDAVSRGEAPGTLYVIEPDEVAGDVSVDAHGLRPERIAALVRALGGRLEQLKLVGCEPADMSEGIYLTEAVAAAVEPAAEIALRLATEPMPVHG